jgi:hypothetical protein
LSSTTLFGMLTPSSSLTAELSARKCRACPAVGIAGDSRCKVLSASDLETDPSSTSAHACPTCGCQECPDLKLYSNGVTDYCKASPSTQCVKPARFHCLIACPSDKRCTTLDFDRDAFACACACQKCPDGQYYQTASNYTAATALTLKQQEACPNVVHPVVKAHDLCT